jgi:hypothetical protein
VTVGALGESPKVSALESETVPAFVVTVTLFVPPTNELGLVNVRLVPASDSDHSVTGEEPTDIAVTPTKKLPLIRTVAPPVFGIEDLSVLVTEGS